MLGNPNARRLSIVSLRIRHQERYLHHNFVVAVLNDLFGIQARGGCSCAGPYGHRLLDIDSARSVAFDHEIQRGCEGVKPGWTRINFNYFISDTVADYLIEAVIAVAERGYRLLPDYRFDPATGLWLHRSADRKPPLSLADLRRPNRAAGRLRGAALVHTAARMPGARSGLTPAGPGTRSVGRQMKITCAPSVFSMKSAALMIPSTPS